MITTYLNQSKGFLNLSLILAKSEFKIKNTSVYSGIGWQLLNSFLLAGLLWLVFAQQLGQKIPSYPVYLLIGVIIFNFFQRATTEATNKFITWGAVIKTLRFPYRAVILATIWEALLAHLLEFFIVAVLFIFILKIAIIDLFFYFLVLLLLVIFIYGLSLLLATLTTLLVDVSHFWRLVSPLLLFATPIFYAPGHRQFLVIFNSFNPLYYYITLARDLVISGRISGGILFGAVAFSLAAWLISNYVFCKVWYHLVEKF